MSMTVTSVESEGDDSNFVGKGPRCWRCGGEGHLAKGCATLVNYGKGGAKGGMRGGKKEDVKMREEREER